MSAPRQSNLSSRFLNLSGRPNQASSTSPGPDPLRTSLDELTAQLGRNLEANNGLADRLVNTLKQDSPSLVNVANTLGEVHSDMCYIKNDIARITAGHLESLRSIRQAATDAVESLREKLEVQNRDKEAEQERLFKGIAEIFAKHLKEVYDNQEKLLENLKSLGENSKKDNEALLKGLDDLRKNSALDHTALLEGMKNSRQDSWDAHKVLLDGLEDLGKVSSETQKALGTTMEAINTAMNEVSKTQQALKTSLEKMKEASSEHQKKLIDGLKEAINDTQQNISANQKAFAQELTKTLKDNHGRLLISLTDAMNQPGALEDEGKTKKAVANILEALKAETGVDIGSFSTSAGETLKEAVQTSFKEVTKAVVGGGARADSLVRNLATKGIFGIGVVGAFFIGMRVLGIKGKQLEQANEMLATKLKQERQQLMIKLAGGLGVVISVTLSIVGPRYARQQKEKAYQNKLAEKFEGGFKRMAPHEISAQATLDNMVGDSSQQEVKATLAEIRHKLPGVTTLVGPPGTGKTRIMETVVNEANRQAKTKNFRTTRKTVSFSGNPQAHPLQQDHAIRFSGSGKAGLGNKLFSQTFLKPTNQNEVDGVAYYKIEGPKLSGKDGPEILRRLRKDINLLPEGTTVLLFLDEADSALRKRGKGNLEDDRVVNMVLTMMNGMEGFKKGLHVRWFLASNYPQLLDDAFISRSRIVQVPLPTPEELSTYFKKFILQSQRFAPVEAFDMKEIVDQCKDFSYRDAQSTVSELERHLIMKLDDTEETTPKFLEFGRADLLEVIQTVAKKKDTDTLSQSGIKI